MKKKSPLAVYLDELKEAGRPISMAKLANLSDLTLDEVGLFSEAWPSIAAQRRYEILTKLIELAEGNPELNFDNVFSSCVPDPDPAVRAKAAEGLAESEEPVVMDKLLALLQNDDDANVRARAATSLGKFALMGEMEGLSPRRVKKLTTVLLAAVNDVGEDIEVRRRALEAVSVSSLPEVKDAIREAYQSGVHSFKVGALYAMGRNCDPVWLPILFQELSNESPEIRYEAAVACGEIEEQEAVPHLVVLVKDPDNQVRLAAVDALGKIGGPQARNTLQECLDGAEPGLHSAAVDALELLEMQEAPISFTHRL